MPDTPPIPADSSSYDADFFTPLFAVEDRHFWFRSRNTVISALVENEVRRLPAGYRVLEVGCGTGNVLRELGKVCKNGQVIGMDLFIEGLEYAQRRVGLDWCKETCTPRLLASGSIWWACLTCSSTCRMTGMYWMTFTRCWCRAASFS